MSDYYDNHRFFVKDGPHSKWVEVDADGFKAAERRAGFRPKGGGDGFATGGFGSSVSGEGKIIHNKWFDPENLATLSELHPYREVARDTGITVTLWDFVEAYEADDWDNLDGLLTEWSEKLGLSR